MEEDCKHSHDITGDTKTRACAASSEVDHLMETIDKAVCPTAEGAWGEDFNEVGFV